WEASADELRGKIQGSFEAFQIQSNTFMLELEALVKLGMSREEVQDLYRDAEWPENWWPPFMRKQEKNWLLVKEFMTEEDKEIRARLEAETALGLLANGVMSVQATVLKNVGDTLGATGLVDSTDAKEVDKWLTLVSCIITLGDAGKKAVGTLSGEGLETQDPVEQLMGIDDALNSIASLGSGFLGAAQSALDVVQTVGETSVTTAEILAKAVPALGTLKAFGDACQHAIQAANLWISAVADSKVHQKALEQGHQAEAATDLVQSRGKHVASRKTADAAADVLTFAGYICDLSGVGVVVGVALRATGSVVTGVKSTFAWVIDTNKAQEARKLLEEARAGNPVAREEIFRHHGRYAVALIAILAKEEGDPIALAIYNNHSITEDMVAKSSVRVLKKYLMRELVVEDVPTDWTSWKKTIVDAATAVKGFFATVANGVRDLTQCIQPFFLVDPTDGKLAEADLAILTLGATHVDAVSRGVDDLAKARRTYEELRLKVASLPETDTELSKWKEALADSELQIKACEQALTNCQTQVSATMKEAAVLFARVQQSQNDDAPRTKTSPPTKTVHGKLVKMGSARRFRALIDEQRRCLTLLAQVA
ncbi:MAG: hypothetical protein H6741_22200, partial [Alphaproteobacteria bacterium]|nr:hypothetical protein [Alphaproteobacteria bacterium]